MPLGTRDKVGRSCRHLPDHAASQCDVNFFTLIVTNGATIAVAPISSCRPIDSPKRLTTNLFVDQLKVAVEGN